MAGPTIPLWLELLSRKSVIENVLNIPFIRSSGSPHRNIGSVGLAVLDWHLKSPDFIKATSIFYVAFFCGAEQLSDGFLW